MKKQNFRMLLAIAALAATSSSHAVLIDFADLASAGDHGIAGYASAGYRIGSSRVENDAFFVWGRASPDFAGQVALTNGWDGLSTVLTREDGATFSLVSMDLSEAWRQPSYDPTAVVFVGTRADGSTVRQQVTLDGLFGFQHVDFGSDFAAVTSVSWIQSWQYHQFGNVAVIAVPLPTTLALLLTGLMLMRRH
ncbi:hypothetical protein [Chitinivorax sp. B]|uniref:hypothetical protein n=1 Tax=Chitinivorax sp. B TaxID=2502235 RepID=UPI0010F716C7|nr:hypothetical protein [Chitinivorax sp. B]